MLFTYLFRNPAVWTFPLLIQILCYYRILGKMGKRKYCAIIPILGDMEMSSDLFRSMGSFWRPALICIAMFLTSRYLGMDNEYSLIMAFVALIVYGVFLIRLYWRLAKQFGKGKGFALGLILIPLVFLAMLGFGKKNVYLGKPEFKADKKLSPMARRLRKSGSVMFSVAELVVLIVGCFLITTIVHPFRPVAQYMLDDTMKQIKDVTDSDEFVGRDVTLGAGYEAMAEKQRTRDYFFPDHSAAKKVVVMEYIIGADLEDDRGMASINIAQMKDTTAKGDGLDFVVQAGGSDRWFTKGIEDSTVGRYLISGGNIETAEMLDETTCMSDPESLTDFILWAKKNYPADRYMLVLWDHGGGFASGYGVDILNDREDKERLMSASEIIGAIKKAGMKFEMIGFDACLMQNIEYANALEPYADYYLASEETEPGTGWYYTAGFGKLAEDPAISIEEFGKSMVSSYDQVQRALNEGEPDPKCTLSLVDLTLVKPVYKQLTGLYKKATADMADKPAVFANMSAARSGAYQFFDEEQVDLVSYLTNLKKADYRQAVTSDEELDRIADTVKACVVYRNSDSAEGINGMAIDFPYKDLSMYSSEYKQLKAVKYRTEQKFFDTFCSIMGAQQMRADAEDDSLFGILGARDYSEEEWYIKGFEDYDTTDLFVDIPVTAVEEGYLPELPDKTWDTILDCKVAAYLVTDEGLMYIGREHFSDTDAEGHPIVSMDGAWARINGHVVCYEADEPLVTEEGTIFRGMVKARLNGSENITLHIEWDPVSEDQEAEPSGRVTGYSIDDDQTLFFMKKGLEQFETGDTIEFLFDFYDEEGNLLRTGTYGDKQLVITEDQMTVRDEVFESGSVISYFGILTDVYQRDLMTEEIREQVQ
ncbi:MAG: hypothetical protein IKG25_04940 [Mogibacterium sp.]|nr:hypothetical protein [Mogibacterium sp.]